MKKEIIVKINASIKDIIKMEMSKKYYRYLKRQNANYYLNGKVARTHEMAQPGDLIAVEFDEIQCKDEMTFDYDLDIIFECEDYIIINKPAGLNTIPSRRDGNISLYNALYTYLLNNDRLKTIHIITRLDKETSGLVLVALNKECALFMNKGHDKMNKIYYAICDGVINENHFFIDKPIAKANDSIKRFIREDGKKSLTEVWVLNTEQNTSLLKIKLHTGRTHQIRVHLASIGHPLIGDSLYGVRADCGLKLHCAKIAFYDNKGEFKEFESKPSWLD